MTALHADSHADSQLVVRLKGGLGNQLFCYATARRLALKNGAQLLLDDVTGFKYDYLYRRQYALGAFHIPVRRATAWERQEPFGRLRRMRMRKISEALPLAQKRYILQKGVAFDEGLLSLVLQPGLTYFDGFGQSERYFSDIEDNLREDLRMRPPTDMANQNFARRIQEAPSVALHVRWFDAGTQPSVSNMSQAYYRSAVSHIEAHVAQPHFFIFSDDAQRAADMLAPVLQGREHSFVDINGASTDASKDLWLMSQCQHFVIGNSTFAWWAAWLGERKGRTQVLAPALNIDPKTNITAWGFPYLLPERWHTL